MQAPDALVSRPRPTHRLSRRWRVAVAIALGLLLLTPAALSAATASGRGAQASPVAAQLEMLQRASSAIVGLRVDAIEGALSAESLGPRRVGSGVVIGEDGLILTIGYLLLEAQNVEVTTSQDKTVPARPVAYDLATGFGLLRPLIPLRGVQPAALGGSAELAPGDMVLAGIGGSGGGIGMTQLVSKRPFSGYWEYHIESALFTSPPVPNHSGAPLFNRKGELIGIGSLFTTDAVGGGRSGVPGNMFVPVDLLKPVLAEMQSTGSTRASRRPWLGLSSSEQAGRVEIVRVSRQSPAESAGLRPGDVVLEIDGAKVATLEAFYKQLWAHEQPDDEIELTVLQGADVRKIRLRAIDRMQTMRKPAGI
jgi:S1-C subfamily serine protease